MGSPTEEIRLPSPTAIAESYLEAIRTKDPSKALLASDATLQFPLSPRKIVGRADIFDYMASVLPGVNDVRIERHLTSGEYVATIWEIDTAWGVLPACTVFRIAGGLIHDIRSFWDPRPVMPHR